MRLLLLNILGFILLMTNAFAQEVNIKVDPQDPVMGESFRVIFEISSKSGTDPIINFDPSGVEVTARDEIGTSTRTTYVNGRLSVKRTISVAYEMTAPRSGSVYLRNINVELNNGTIKHKNVRINILKTAKRAKDIFVMAHVNKNDVFVGESIVLRYYLYSKVQLSNFEIKKFPKLSKFMKRFHQENMNAERVRYGGDIYLRRVVYTSQLFVEKPGTVKVDPISLNVFYSDRRSRPFGGFGFNTGRAKRRTVVSKSVEIKVRQLPLDGIPKSFTGLVGKHEFSAKINKNKFIANEPIEIQLKVKGPGALELMEPPQVLSHPGIEEFDSTPDLKVEPDFTAQKTFDYTYLGRENLKISDKKIALSYFDPELQKYVEKTFPLGNIIVAGASAAPAVKDTTAPANPTPSQSANNTPTSVTPEVSPIVPLYKGISTFVYNAKTITTILLGLLILSVFGVLIKFFTSRRTKELGLFQSVYSSGVSYRSLHQIISSLGEGASMRIIVENSNLESETKKYFIELIEKFNDDYKSGKSLETVKVNKKMFKEVEAILNKENG